MDEINIKKLITRFLGIAIIVSVLILVLSSLIPSSQPSRTQSNLTILNESTMVASNTDQALSPVPASVSNFYASSTQDYSNNLTEYFAKSFAQSIVGNNPSGPVNLSGQPSILTPDVNQIAQQFTDYVQNNNVLVIPDANYQYQIIDNPTPQENSDYIQSLQKILSDTILNNQNEDMATSTLSVDDFATMNIVYDQALQRLAVIPVPRPFLGVQQSLIKLINDKKIIYGELANYQADPMKAAVITQSSNLVQDLFNQDQQNFQAEINKIHITVQKVSYRHSLLNQVGYLFNSFINKANAAGNVVPVGDTQAESLLGQIVAATKQKNNQDSTITPWWKNLLQIFTQALVHQMIVETIKWVNNGFNGQPQFIQNWQSLLTNAAENAGVQELSNLIPGICKPFRFTLNAALLPTNPAPEPTCTLSDIGANLQNFTNDFSNGGWVEFGNSLQMQNSFIGSYMLTEDAVNKAESKAQSEANNEAIANGGFLAQTKCTAAFNQVKVGSDGSITGVQSGGTHSTSGQTTVINGVAAGSSFNSNVDKLDPNSSLCAETKVQTPGQLINSTLSKAVGVNFDEWVNAKDVTALVNAFVNAAITKLVEAGQNGLLGMNVSSYKQPVPLYQLQQNTTLTAGPHDINTLTTAISNASQYYSAGQLINQLGAEIPPLINSAVQTPFSTYLPQITKYTLDVASSTCSNIIQKSFVDSVVKSLTDQVNQDTKQVGMNAPQLSIYTNALQYLQDYDQHFSTSGDPIADYKGIFSGSVAQKIQSDINSISTAGDATSLNQSLTIALSDLRSIDDNLSKLFNSEAVWISLYYASADPIHATNIKNNEEPAIITIASQMDSTTTQALTNLQTQIAADVAEENSINAASSTLNNYYTQLQGVNADLTVDIQTAPLRDATSSLFKESSTTIIIENNLTTALTNFKAANPDIFSQSGADSILSYLQSSTFASDAANTENIINQETDPNNLDSDAKNLYNLAYNEINNLSPLISNSLNQFQNVNIASTYSDAPQVAQSADQALTSYFNSLTFNGLVNYIADQINNYSYTTSNLQDLANLRCNLKGIAKTNPYESALKDMVSKVNGSNSSGNSLNFMPQVCMPIDGASPCSTLAPGFTVKFTYYTPSSLAGATVNVYDNKGNLVLSTSSIDFDFGAGPDYLIYSEVCNLTTHQQNNYGDNYGSINNYYFSFPELQTVGWFKWNTTDANVFDALKNYIGAYISNTSNGLALTDGTWSNFIAANEDLNPGFTGNVQSIIDALNNTIASNSQTQLGNSNPLDISCPNSTSP